MKRRDFIALVGGVVGWPLAVRAQQPKQVVRIGFLTTGELLSPEANLLVDAFRKGLREHGYVEGTNILVEWRGANGNVQRFPALAAELVSLKLDVIVATNSLAARAVHHATTTIPIVVPVMGDPVADGLVASLARPGGNITGLTFLGPDLLPKRLALLKEALPTASQVAGLWHPGAYGERTMSDMMKGAEATAQTLGVRLRLSAVQGPDELHSVFSSIAGADALLVFPSPMLFSARKRIVELATKHRLPSMSMGRELVELGGLISYGANITDLHRLIASHVDKIIRGAKPGELPVEQPTRFELAINLKTAKALGLTIPPSLLARADEVIE